MNYTDEQTQYIINEYKKEPTMETVLCLAEELNKTHKSIIGKLSREGVYERAVYKNKSGELPVTKMEIVNYIAENLGLEVESLVGLEKSPKATLKTLEIATGVEQFGYCAPPSREEYVKVQQALGGHDFDTRLKEENT